MKPEMGLAGCFIHLINQVVVHNFCRGSQPRSAAKCFTGQLGKCELPNTTSKVPYLVPSYSAQTFCGVKALEAARRRDGQLKNCDAVIRNFLPTQKYHRLVLLLFSFGCVHSLPTDGPLHLPFRLGLAPLDLTASRTITSQVVNPSSISISIGISTNILKSIKVRS